jgi:DNA-binding NarL/FixJ family response regulator
MRTPRDIKDEIARLSERRAEVLHLLSEGYTTELAAEHQGLEEQIATLWDEHRHARVETRFGDRTQIIERARHEERLSRAA